ncbi:MAG: GNAT family N-acetyltransferase, partial [Anaerolineales bacterium]|nr:GNAT family N-acetyltransferase [Anaerolineales bacterium]
MTTVRLASLQDILGLSHLSTQLGYVCPVEKIQLFLKDLDHDSDHSVFVAESGYGGLAGYVHVFKTKRLFLKPFAELGGLVVEKSYRGRGIGKILLAAAEGWANDQGCQEMRVRSNVLRERARPFYLGAGYQDVKKQTVYTKT